jgi:hypothetical protein
VSGSPIPAAKVAAANPYKAKSRLAITGLFLDPMSTQKQLAHAIWKKCCSHPEMFHRCGLF